MQSLFLCQKFMVMGMEDQESTGAPENPEAVILCSSLGIKPA
jgi:hypothetical protein